MRKSLIILGILDDTDVEWMIAYGERRTVSAGETLIRQGEETDAIFILLEGALDVVLERPARRHISTLYPGEIVGEVSLLDSRPPIASVVARDRSTLLAVPRDQVLQKLRSDIGFQARLYRALGVFLAHRLRTTNLLVAGADVALSAEEEDEAEVLDTEVLEGLGLAGKRFEMIVARVQSFSGSRSPS